MEKGTRALTSFPRSQDDIKVRILNPERRNNFTFERDLVTVFLSVLLRSKNEKDTEDRTLPSRLDLPSNVVFLPSRNYRSLTTFVLIRTSLDIVFLRIVHTSTNHYCKSSFVEVVKPPVSVLGFPVLRIRGRDTVPSWSVGYRCPRLGVETQEDVRGLRRGRDGGTDDPVTVGTSHEGTDNR